MLCVNRGIHGADEIWTHASALIERPLFHLHLATKVPSKENNNTKKTLTRSW